MKHFLNTDNDSHWYIIPEEKRDDWSAFCELDSDDEASWNVPAWATRIDGHPSWIVFENPVQK